jgi:CubicO group peptidase (beta-lactamase class C family)
MISHRTDALHQNADASSAFDLLESWLEGKIRNHVLPGLSAGVVHDQELIWSAGFGFGDIEKALPSSTNLRYRVASITKLFTSIAAMQLRDRGLLRLDDPIQAHLPWFRIRGYDTGSPPITVESLMTHSSGVPRDSELPIWTDAVFQTREEIAAALPDRELSFAPGSKRKYANLGFFLLGEIVSVLSGEEYSDYVRRHILEPLGMRDTVLHPSLEAERMATGYGRLDSEGRRPVEPFMESKGFVAAAGMASTVEDLARFAGWQFRNDGSILRSETLDEMRRLHWIDDEWSSGVGLGFGIRRWNGLKQVGHSGALPGFSSTIQTWPAKKLAVILLVNVISGDPLEWVPTICEMIAPAIEKAWAQPEPEPAADPAWNRLCGVYENRWGESRVVIESGRLIIRGLLYPTLPPAIFQADGDGAFRLEGGANDGEAARFEIDGEGNVTALRMAGERFTRKS